MTREEAKQALAGTVTPLMRDFYIDMFVALGALKLDQSKSIADKLHDSLKYTKIDFMMVWDAIERAGLKLVDK